MSRSLFTALSGMRVNQQWIDVIGNNLANSNTPGFKTTRATFTAALSQTLRFASGPSGSTGGRNPDQIGLGAGQLNTQRTFSQGALTSTGRIFDLALEGNGFFSLRGNGQRHFTRVGAFGLDADSNVVDQNTGFFVLDRSGEPLQLDTDSLYPPKGTENVGVVGNLPATVSGPLAEVMTNMNPFESGTSASLSSTIAGPTWATGQPAGTAFTLDVVVSGSVPQQVSVLTDASGDITQAAVVAALDALDGVSATAVGNDIQVETDRVGDEASLKVIPGTPNNLAGLIGLPTTVQSGVSQPVTSSTGLNSLTANIADYVAGDTIEVTGLDTDGSPINATFTYGTDGTTLADLVTFLDGVYAQADVTLQNGQIRVTSTVPGEADLLMTLEDGASNVGASDWLAHSVTVDIEGTAPDEVAISTEVYDMSGVAHTLTLNFERQADLTWSIVASMPQADGEVMVGGDINPITGVRFNSDGSPSGLGGVNKTLLLRFAGQSQSQEVQLDFGTDGLFEGITQFGNQSSLVVDSQDGYTDGELANMVIDPSGTISGFYTNGQVRDLGELGIASFTNVDGLAEAGNNLYVETPNSGAISIGEGGNLGRGSVVSGSLENSNVDTAEQFVRLIEAQRGFQANARVISTVDEVLAEVVNLI